MQIHHYHSEAYSKTERCREGNSFEVIFCEKLMIKKKNKMFCIFPQTSWAGRKIEVVNFRQTVWFLGDPAQGQ